MEHGQSEDACFVQSMNNIINIKGHRVGVASTNGRGISHVPCADPRRAQEESLSCREAEQLL